jgi:Flp pilus assembly pilin Flp
MAPIAIGLGKKYYFREAVRPDPKGGDTRMSRLQSLVADLLVGSDSSTGQGLAEYALIISLIAIVAIVGLLFLGGQVSGSMSTIGQTI